MTSINFHFSLLFTEAPLWRSIFRVYYQVGSFMVCQWYLKFSCSMCPVLFYGVTFFYHGGQCSFSVSFIWQVFGATMSSKMGRRSWQDLVYQLSIKLARFASLVKSISIEDWHLFTPGLIFSVLPPMFSVDRSTEISLFWPHSYFLLWKYFFLFFFLFLFFSSFFFLFFFLYSWKKKEKQKTLLISVSLWLFWRAFFMCFFTQH